MTNAEAITMLKRMQEPEAWEPQITEEAFNALDMAITALRNEQKAEESLLKSDPDSVSNDDVVYRQAAENAIYHHFPKLSMDEARMIMHEVPSAQPELHRGEGS